MAYRFDSTGWVTGIAHCASPNYNARPCEVDLLVIHCISLPPGEFGGPYIQDLFLNQLDCQQHPYFAQLQDMQVSAHFVIDRNGEPTQFVSCDQRAWHAGQSAFGGRAGCNDFSIGIELEGTESEAYTPAQYQTLVALTQAIQLHYPAITNERITGHEDIAPGRKTDPGPSFDWQHYRKALIQIGAMKNLFSSRRKT